MIIIRWIMSIIFIIQMYLVMAIIALGFAPWALFSENGARAACRAYARWVIFSLRILCGIRTQVRGIAPKDNVIIGAKHHSFFDIIVIYANVPHARFIMKHELIYAPFVGLYALRMGMIPVKRGKRGAAMAKLKKAIASGHDGGQVVIYPQGTRVLPGEKAPYKQGIAAIYEQLDQPVVPVATNIGIFWPKRSLLRKPGLAVVEFLPEIPAGLPAPEMMSRLEHEVETHSDHLMAEAGFKY